MKKFLSIMLVIIITSFMLFGQSSPINPVSLRYYIENIHFTKFRADSLTIDDFATFGDSVFVDSLVTNYLTVNDSAYIDTLTIGTKIIPDANDGASIGTSTLQFLNIYARHIDGDTVFVGVWGQNIDADQKMITDLGTLKTDSVISNTGNLKLSGAGAGYVEVTDTLSPATYFTPYQQEVTVAKSGAEYTTIMAAINSISDAASDKIYTVLVSPGEYDEAITLKNYVNIVAVDPSATKILRQVTDNNVECHCYLNITIESASGYGLYIRNANSVVELDGDVSSSNASGVLNYGTTTVNGNISSSVDMGMSSSGSGLLIVNGDVSSVSNNAAVYLTDGDIILNGNIINTRNESHGHGVNINGNGAFTHRNGSIYVTHADAKAIYASSAKNVYCMGVWSNRDLGSNITNLISGGFTFDSNVPSP